MAVSDDSSGTYYNPAGIAFASGDSMSGSSNTFHITEIAYKGVVGSYDLTRSSATLLPNYFAMLRRMGPFTFGFSYVVPDTDIEHQNQIFSNLDSDTETYLLSYHLAETTTLMGPSVAYQLNDKLAAGLTLYYFAHDSRAQGNQYLKGRNSSTESMRTLASDYIDEVDQFSGVMPKFGIVYSPIEPVSIGATVSRVFLLKSSARGVTTQYSDTTKETTFTEFNNSSPVLNTPWQASVGIAYFPSPFFLFACDLDYFRPTNSQRISVFNISAGGEWFLDDSNAVRCGFFTNNSSAPKPSANTFNVSKVDMLGFSAGYSVYSQASNITAGFIYSSGTGQVQVVRDIFDMTQYSLTFVLAASYGL